jgi:hypothetical protein
MSTSWFYFMRFWYLLFTFVTRPICKKIDRRLFSKLSYIQTHDEYLEYRRKLEYSTRTNKPGDVFKNFLEWTDAVTLSCIWEEDHYIWWNTVTDIEACNDVRYCDASWGIRFCMWKIHAINSIRKHLTGKYHPDD